MFFEGKFRAENRNGCIQTVLFKNRVYKGQGPPVGSADFNDFLLQLLAMLYDGCRVFFSCQAAYQMVRGLYRKVQCRGDPAGIDVSFYIPVQPMVEILRKLRGFIVHKLYFLFMGL
jgi:hypothetical protein